ncbi:MAG: type II secretion system protein GspC [bacterium]
MGASLKKYIWILGLLCIIIISYFLAKIVTLYIEGYFPNDMMTLSAEVKKSQVVEAGILPEIDVNAILKRNIFSAEEITETTMPIEDDQQQQQVTSDVAVETKLSIKLISTISVGDGKNQLSSCVVESDRKTDAYIVGGKKTFSPGVKIVSILPKRVEFINGGQLEYVKLQEFAKGYDMTKPLKQTPTTTKRVARTDESDDESIVRQGDSFQIARSEVDSALSNMSKLYTDIRGVPYFDEGVARGFKILSVKKGSLFDKLGIKRGDILKSVNGRTLDIQSGFETFKSLKTETEFELEIERRGEAVNYKYEII